MFKVDDLKIAKEVYDKKFEAMSIVLVEEKVYESDAKIFFDNTTTRKTKIKSSKPLKSSRKKKKRGSKLKRTQTVKLDYANFYFGFFTTVVILFILIICFSILQYIYYSITYPQAQRVSNLMEVYILGVETWSSYFSLHVFMLETVLYNNSLVVWKDQKPLEVYDYFKKHIQDNVLANYSALAEKDLAGFNEEFKYALNQVSLLTPNPREIPVKPCSPSETTT